MLLWHFRLFTSKCGPGSSVGIATELRAGGPGSNPGGDKIFPPVQTGPGAHLASCTMGTGSFPGVKCGRGVLLLVPRSWKSRAIPLGHTGPVTGSLYLSTSKYGYSSWYIVNMPNMLIYFSWSIRIEYGRLSSSYLGVFLSLTRQMPAQYIQLALSASFQTFFCISALAVSQSFDTIAMHFLCSCDRASLT